MPWEEKTMSLKRIVPVLSTLCAVAIVVFGVAETSFADGLAPRQIVVKPANTQVDLIRFRTDVISVKFRDDQIVRLGEKGLTDLGTGALNGTEDVFAQIAGGRWERAHTLSVAQLNRLRATAQNRLQREVADLNLQFNYYLPEGLDAETAIDALNSLDIVEIALPAPRPMAAPLPPSFQASQGYLNAATAGVDAVCLWQLVGGTGSNVSIADIEYSWNMNHQDYSATLLGATPNDPFNDNNHGTAVLGEMVSISNGWGTTGISHGSTMYVVAANTGSGSGTYDVGAAITTAMGTLSAGDVILIEQQIAGPNYTGIPPGTQFGLVPVEWYQPWYNTIVTAVGNGVVVVEAAGNGSQNLDDAVYNTGHAPFTPANDSGAIIVGAGASPGGSDTDRSRLGFSNYGSTVDLQGWGENVVTTGYNDLYSAEGTNLWYTSTFSGTSSASPIVAGACATLQSAHLSGAGSFLTPAQVKAHLQATGSAQQAGTYPTSQNIGPRPDAAAAFCNAVPAADANANLVPDLCESLAGIEACCFTNGACTDTTPANCAAYGGTAQGVGTACATTTCQAPYEACCLSNGTCVDIDAPTCVSFYGGTPMGLGTTCATVVCPATNEACCLPNGSCVDTTPANCLALYGGTPMGAGTACATTQCPQPPEACCMPDLTCQYVPAGSCAAMGGWLTPGGMCLGDNDGIPGDDACQDGPPEFLIEFSLDIGSDIELSDPTPDGNEAADPGDVYWWQSLPIVPPGRDGFKDDLRIFVSADPWPDPPDTTGGTAVPVGFGSIEDYHEYFDLDGHDQTDFSLHDAEFPMPAFPSECVYEPKYLAVSFDDDMGPGWPVMDVPVTRPSMAGVSSYGSTPGQDEVVGVTVDTAPPLPPYPIMNIYPVADEITVHQSMVPNPDGIEEHDDDVDSLDAVPDRETCPFWFFSPDHEADMGLDPGGIYEVTGFGPVQVIDEAFHLGLPEETDIDAFEFTWLENPDQPGMPFLALLFSVDNDDPLTLGDESGGNDPTMIFVSWMTGFSMPFTDPLEDDVDAIMIWRDSFEPQPIGACCFADGTCTDAMSEIDCINNNGKWQGAGSLCVNSNCCPCPGDLDGNGVVNGDDIQCFVECLLGSGIAVGCNCDCADMQPDGFWNDNDVVPFVNELLNTTVCTWP